jgi:hypothetical protein
MESVLLLADVFARAKRADHSITLSWAFKERHFGRGISDGTGTFGTSMDTETGDQIINVTF